MKLKSINNQIFSELITVESDTLVSLTEIKAYLRIENYPDDKLLPYYEAAINFL